MSTGIRISDKDVLAGFDFVFALHNGSTGPLSSTALATALAATGAVADAIAAKAPTTVTDDHETRIEALEAAVGDFALQGGWDASSGSSPAAASANDLWEVNTAGTVDGIPFVVGDQVVALVDAASTTTYAGNWYRLEDKQVLSVAGKTGTVTLVKGDVGLGNVDNTADADKPVSTATQTALNAKAPLAGPAFTGDVDMTGADTVTVPDATADGHAVNKGQLDAATEASGSGIPYGVMAVQPLGVQTPSGWERTGTYTDIDGTLTPVVQRVGSDAGRLAATIGGLLVRIDPTLCFQEADYGATTPAAVGDAVGCIRCTDETYRAVATSDAARGTLRQDAAGSFYIEAASSGEIYVPIDSNSNVLDLGTDWCHIGGWHQSGSAGTYYFGTTSTANGGLRFDGAAGLRWPNAAGSLTQIAGNLGYGKPHVVDIERTGADLTCTISNGQNAPLGANPAVVTKTIVPYDVSADTQGLAIFTSRNTASTSAPTGRFYGGYWGPIPTAAQKEIIRADIFRGTFPNVSRTPNGGNPVILDYENSEFSWAGVDRVLGDLTDNGGGHYSLAEDAWFEPEMLIVLDYEFAEGASPSGTLLEIESDAGTVISCAFETINIGGTDTFRVQATVQNQGTDMVLDWPGQSTGIVGWGRHRVGLRLRQDQLPEFFSDGRPAQSNTTVFYTAMDIPTGIHTGANAASAAALTNATLHSAAIYPGRYTDAEVRALMADTSAKVHLLGDSFPASNKIERYISQELASYGDYALTSTDGVGGSTATEQAARHALYPAMWDAVTVHIDGAWELASTQTRDQWLNALARIDERLTARLYIVEANPIRSESDGDPEIAALRTAWNDLRTFAESLVPDGCFVGTLAAIQCLNDGSANDLSDIADDIWPRSQTGDGTHPNDTAKIVIARAIIGALIANGDMTGTVAVPGAPQTVAAVTGSSSGEIDVTWDMPSDDGRRPVEAHRVSVEDSPGAGTYSVVATDLRARAYTITGLTAGATYGVRVESYNPEGWGSVGSDSAAAGS